jgi:Rps23 Pro-64 3,4-dihydroxylase Tpa1-like proline 4-hydroxylase
MDIINQETGINHSYKVTHYKHPYKIWVIDDFLDFRVLTNIKKEWLPTDSPIWHKGHRYIEGKENILEQGMRSISKLENIPPYTSKVLKYIHTDEFTRKIGNIIGMEDLIPDKSFRWSGPRVMVPGSFQAIHSDARKNPETGLRKELTCLIYLNENYTPERDKGHFEVWNDDMTQCVHKIEPRNNRLVIFHNTDKSYHGVPEVNFERKALLWSILKNAEVNSRTKALFVSRPEDSEEISILGKKRAYIKDNIQ